MKKTRLVTTLFSIAFATMVTAQNHVDLDGEVQFGIKSEYHLPLISKTVYDDPIFWGSAKLNLTKDMWLHYHFVRGLGEGFEDLSSDRGDQDNFTIGWTEKFWNLDTAVSTSFLNFYPIEQIGNGDKVLTSLNLSRKFRFGDHVFIPNTKVSWLSKANELTSGSVVFTPNVVHIWNRPLGLDDLTFRQQIMVTHNTNFPGTFVHWSTWLDFSVNENLTLGPNFRLVFGREKPVVIYGFGGKIKF